MEEEALYKALDRVLSPYMEEIMIILDGKSMGGMEVSTEPQKVILDGIQEVSARVDLSEVIKRLEELVPKDFPSEIKVANPNDFPQSVVSVDNSGLTKALKEYKNILVEVKKALESLAKKETVVNVEQKAQPPVKLPKTPIDYVSVRLTDGERFYKAMGNTIAGSGSYGDDSGSNETDKLPLKSRVILDGNFTYIARAEPGTPFNQALWRIKRINNTDPTDVITEWAEGTPGFEHLATSKTVIKNLNYF